MTFNYGRYISNYGRNISYVECRLCHGTGLIPCSLCNGRGCWSCSSTGKTKCLNCFGSGKKMQYHVLTGSRKPTIRRTDRERLIGQYRQEQKAVEKAAISSRNSFLDWVFSTGLTALWGKLLHYTWEGIKSLFAILF